MPNDVTDVDVWLDVLAGSHDRLSDLVGGLDDEALGSKSYCSDWTIAQVVSHLGSGAEIMGGTVDAAVAGEDPPSTDTYPKIWERWNAMTPREAADSGLSTDGGLVEKFEHLGDGLAELEFTVFGGMRMDAVGLLRMRLSEHAVHSWDVGVALDPGARVDHDAVNLLLDGMTRATAWLGKAERADVERPFIVRVVTSDPDRELDLEVSDTVKMTLVEGADGGSHGGAGAHGGASKSSARPASAGVLHLPAEAFLRLVYGRLDPSHAPDVDASEATTLDTLRKVFPGF